MAASNKGKNTTPGGTRILRLSSTAEIDDERLPLFYIDDTEYSIAAHPSATLGLEYLERVQDSGPEVANAWMLKTLLGDEAYAALKNYKALTVAQLAQIVEIAGETLVGATEPPKGS